MTWKFWRYVRRDPKKPEDDLLKLSLKRRADELDRQLTMRILEVHGGVYAHDPNWRDVQ